MSPRKWNFSLASKRFMAATCTRTPRNRDVVAWEKWLQTVLRNRSLLKFVCTCIQPCKLTLPRAAVTTNPKYIFPWCRQAAPYNSGAEGGCMQQDENPPTQDLSERRCRQPRCSSGGSEPSIALGCSGLASQSTPPDGIKTVCPEPQARGSEGA
jgi:hypothetical protein